MYRRNEGHYNPAPVPFLAIKFAFDECLMRPVNVTLQPTSDSLNAFNYRKSIEIPPPPPPSRTLFTHPHLPSHHPPCTTVKRFIIKCLN